MVQSIRDHLAEKLMGRGFKVSIVNCSKDAIKLLEKMIPENSKVGLPGSVTLRQIGIKELLTSKKCVIIDTWAKGDRANRLEQLNADVVLTSSNAVTEEGMLVNLDGTGNRVAAMCYGPKKVISVIGKNKITKNLEEALHRVKNVAAPQIYKSKQANTPCTKTGRCHDCQTVATKQCRVLTIHEGKPRGIEEFHIILVEEELGY